MLSLIRNGSNGVLQLFKDGNLVGTSSSGQNGQLTFSSTQMSIGSEQNWIQTNFGTSIDEEYLNGVIDDIAIYNRALTNNEIQTLYNNGGTNAITKVNWSTSDTTNSILITPTNSTTYSCTQRLGSFTLIDSVRVTVNALPVITLPDTTIAFKQDSILLNAGTGFSKYVWSRGDTTQSIWVKTAGMNKVTIFNSAGCSNIDSTNVIFVKGIQQKDTSICLGKSLNLSIPNGSIQTNGLVGYWPFSGNANDASGNGNNGTPGSGVNLTTDRFNTNNSSYNFNGNGNISLLNLPTSGSQNFSISSWVKTNNTNARKGIACWGQDIPWASTYFYINNSGYLAFDFAYNGGPQSSTFIADNTWHFVSVTNTSGLIQLYIDGIPNASPQLMYPNISGNNKALGTNITNGGNENFIGKLDDISIYNRALNQAEIQTLFNGGNANTKVNWSTNDTTNSITSTPTTSTTYRCTQRIGSFTMTDSVRVTVNALPIINSLPDTTIAFKQDSILLNAGTGYSKYIWSRGDTTQSIWVKTAGMNKVTVFNSTGCSNSDSTNVIFVKGIQQKDSSICLGNSLKLSIPSGTIPTNGLVGYWPFTGNANDVSGNGNNGTVNGATLTSDRFGNLNSAFSFDGINDIITAPAINLPSGNNPRSINLWFKVNNIPAPGTAFLLLNYGVLSSNQACGLAVMNNGVNFVSWLTQNDLIGLSIISVNQWYNLTATYDGSTSKLFLNGNLINSASQVKNTILASLSIGFNGVDQFTNGIIDEIGIWNRALNQTEVQALFNGGNSNTKVNWSTNDTTNSISVAPSTSTIYRCTQRIGSFTMTDSIRVAVRNLPSKTITSNKKGLCKNDTISINVLPGFAYNWYKNNNIIAGSNNALKANIIGNYKAKLTDSTGCSTMSDSVILFNAPLPKVKISLPDTALCLNGNVFKFTDSTTLDSGSFNRIWNFGNGNTSILSTSNQSYATAGNYNTKLKVITNYGCTDSTIKNITVIPNPVAGVMLGQVINLNPSTPYIYTVAQQINHNYNWVVTNGIVVLGQSTNAATVQWINNGNGYVKVEVTNPQGCLDTTAVATKIGNVGMNETSEINNLSLYPNPNHGSFSVGFTLKESSATKLELINMLGQQVWISNMQLQNGEQQIPINLSLSAGVYVLKITTSTGEITKQVLVK
jgi:hypothetical protein